ncbi:TrkA C-terminal domain-containing protein [Domibacillus tundrae]|uniref:TrkA C-terminal domain-containing protein n=1 Tax=Domibacillus tundrae TaxID=1587527 RepID=UPI003398AF6C
MLFILLYLLIIMLVIEVSVIMFNITGLEKPVSRYQVISMLTGTGFTTDESQLIIDHPIRRKISAFLILFGAFSLAVIISAMTNMLSDDFRLTELLVINSVLLILLLIGKTPFLKNKLRKKFDYEMHKNLDISELPIKDALYLDENDVVTEVAIEKDSELVGKEILNLFEKEEDITLLFIKRGEINLRNTMHNESIQAGDDLFLYGNKEEIEKKFLTKDGKEEHEEIEGA